MRAGVQSWGVAQVCLQTKPLTAVLGHLSPTQTASPRGHGGKRGHALELRGHSHTLVP